MAVHHWLVEAGVLAILLWPYYLGVFVSGLLSGAP
jgi:hypothetical protein